jgi:hypothetical protein
MVESNHGPVDSGVVQASSLGKVKVKLATDLIVAIPPLTCTDPEKVLQFLIRATQVRDLKLISDSEFVALLISRTSGRVMQMLGAHIGTPDGWGMVRSEIISNFLPPRVKEQFLTSYVLERFQGPDENLTNFVMAVATAADILGFTGPETQLVRRMLQNLHPAVRSHFVFETRPESVAEMFALATTVAEAVAVDEQRRRATATSSEHNPSSTHANAAAPLPAEFRGTCWACGRTGHIQRACPARQRSSSSSSPSNSASRQGNAAGARR